MPDTRQSAEALLVEVEQQLELVDSALLNDQPSALQEASTVLRRVVMAFARVLESALSAEAFDQVFRRRIEAVAERLSVQRANLARRSVLVDRTLASIMRTPVNAVYSMPGERRAFAAAGIYAVGAH